MPDTSVKEQVTLTDMCPLDDTMPRVFCACDRCRRSSGSTSGSSVSQLMHDEKKVIDPRIAPDETEPTCYSSLKDVSKLSPATQWVHITGPINYCFAGAVLRHCTGLRLLQAPPCWLVHPSAEYGLETLKVLAGKRGIGLYFIRVRGSKI